MSMVGQARTWSDWVLPHCSNEISTCPVVGRLSRLPELPGGLILNLFEMDPSTLLPRNVEIKVQRAVVSRVRAGEFGSTQLSKDALELIPGDRGCLIRHDQENDGIFAFDIACQTQKGDYDFTIFFPQIAGANTVDYDWCGMVLGAEQMLVDNRLQSQDTLQHLLRWQPATPSGEVSLSVFRIPFRDSLAPRLASLIERLLEKQFVAQGSRNWFLLSAILMSISLLMLAYRRRGLLSSYTFSDPRINR